MPLRFLYINEMIFDYLIEHKNQKENQNSLQCFKENFYLYLQTKKNKSINHASTKQNCETF